MGITSNYLDKVQMNSGINLLPYREVFIIRQLFKIYKVRLTEYSFWKNREVGLVKVEEIFLDTLYNNFNRCLTFVQLRLR